MKVVILAGGFGTRLSEETELRPKPLIEVAGRPILWHVMHVYLAAQLNEFVIACGYKSHMIKRYFAEYYLENSDIRVNVKSGAVEYLNQVKEDWTVTCIDTGLETMTGGRVKRVGPYLGNETFCMTYGDGVASIDVRKVIEFHKSHGKLATVTSVRSPGRFGTLQFDSNNRISQFREKPQNEMGWINGGFFVLEPGCLDYIDGDETIWERTPLERLAEAGQLMAYQHEGFWKPMDTLRDKRELEDLWNSGKAPWKIW